MSSRRIIWLLFLKVSNSNICQITAVLSFSILTRISLVYFCKLVLFVSSFCAFLHNCEKLTTNCFEI
jgi:hypothetical protein